MNGRNHSLLDDDRGQTLQDYAFGVGIFLVTVVFVLTIIMPSMLAPFQGGVDSDSEAQANRVSETLVHNASVEGRLNRLNATVVENVVGMDIDDLRERYQLPETSWLNISVETLNGSEVISSGGTHLSTARSPGSTDSATSTRIVTLSDDACRPACRLIVRVW